MRRILVACSLVASVSAIAGYSDFREHKTFDGRVVHVIAQGQSLEVEQPVQQPVVQTVQQDEPKIVLSNATALAKYGSIQRDVVPSQYNTPSTSSPEIVLSSTFSPDTQFNNNSFNRDASLSWLQVHPLSKGRVSSNFGTRVMNGKREGHSGLDIAAPTGTPIVATGPGQVTKAGWGTGYGQYVEIKHNGGYVTRYAHASRIHVRVGDWVQAGQHIANVGCTGRCTGPHLHYEVVKDGQRRNPATYLAMLP